MLAPENKILNGTYHKAGTVWMMRVFIGICKLLNLKYSLSNQLGLPNTFDLFFEAHSNFDFSKIDFAYRGLHVIRDPWDMIVSACFYHLHASELWLHEKRDDFGGLTYQEKINTYPDFDDKLLFEMENSTYYEIQHLLK